MTAAMPRAASPMRPARGSRARRAARPGVAAGASSAPGGGSSAAASGCVSGGVGVEGEVGREGRGLRAGGGGGVAANRLLRERAAALGVPVHIPPPELCTDNAAMIASAARWVEPAAFPSYLALDAYATRHAA